MDEKLIALAKQYADVIEQIERTRNPTKQQLLEERRVELHWEFMTALNLRRIAYTDRAHATAIALRLARRSK